MPRSIDPRTLYDMLRDGKELALIDVREQGEFSKSHLLLASCIPLSRLELLITQRVPRLDTRIVLIDNGLAAPNDLSPVAAERLSAFGYSDISLLAGGLPEWRQAGRTLFSGVNTVSKAFGEFVEHTYDTPRISAQALKALCERNGQVVILDARPEDEFFRMNIPGAVNVPGAELLYRFFDIVQDPSQPVVVNCAGRTRSIIGAQSLINAGVPNRVQALKNGTMGWHLAGFGLEHGQLRRPPAPSAAGREKAAACAARAAARFGVKTVDPLTLSGWQERLVDRTILLLDVRTPEEYAAGHPPDARNAPGGQLVQATDEYVAVRNARLVLIDDDGTRATMTASWLIQMGWADVFVLSGGISGWSALKQAAEPRTPIVFQAECVGPETLSTLLDTVGPPILVDVASSRTYRKAHIPGARWAVRARLTADLSAIDTSAGLVFTSSDGTLAHLAAGDFKKRHPDVVIRVLKGGTAAWTVAGLPTESGLTSALSAPDDVWYKPYELRDAPEKEMKAYLEWEVALVEQLEKDRSIVFKTF